MTDSIKIEIDGVIENILDDFEHRVRLKCSDRIAEDVFRSVNIPLTVSINRSADTVWVALRAELV